MTKEELFKKEKEDFKLLLTSAKLQKWSLVEIEDRTIKLRNKYAKLLQQVRDKSGK